MSAAYFEAAIPEPYRILGLKLKPFSLGHYRLLSRFNSSFVADGEAVAAFDDLVLGVLICSMRYQEFLDFIEKESVQAEVCEWGQRIGEFVLEEKVKLFVAYIAKGSVIPAYWEEEEGNPSGTHWSHALQLILTGELGYSFDEAMNMPLAQAFADYFKHAENIGLVRLMTPEEIAAGNTKEATCGA